MANEKTPLLAKPTDQVVVTILDDKVSEKLMESSMDFDRNYNVITTSLTYEELLPFIIDPSWIRLRKICFTSCWIIFFVILMSACISSFMSMTKMSCGVSSLTASDNDSVEQPNVTSTDDMNGILSIVLNTINGTVTT